MTKFNPENKARKLLTVGDVLGPAMKITDKEDADQYFEAYIQHVEYTLSKQVEHVDRKTLEEIAKQSIGYYAGYYDNEIRERVEKLFNCSEEGHKARMVIEREAKSIRRYTIISLIGTFLKYGTRSFKKGVVVGGVIAVILFIIGILFTEESVQLISGLSLKWWGLVILAFITSDITETISVMILGKKFWGVKPVIEDKDIKKKHVILIKLLDFLMFITIWSLIMLLIF